MSTRWNPPDSPPPASFLAVAVVWLAGLAAGVGLLALLYRALVGWLV